MKFIIERIQNNIRTFHGPYYLESHAQHEIQKRVRYDVAPATYHIHSLLPQADLQKPI